MKKLFSCVFIMLVVMCCSITVFAGDIPESLLFEDKAQVFFAKVVEYNDDSRDKYTKVVPVKVIKGNVKLNEEKVYTHPILVSDFKIKENKAYLFAYLNENNFYVFQVTSYDTKTLELVGVDKDNMMKRFEKSLNEGKFGKTEQQISEELPPLHNNNVPYINIIICVGIVAVCILVVCKVKKKKQLKKDL